MTLLLSEIMSGKRCLKSWGYNNEGNLNGECGTEKAVTLDEPIHFFYLTLLYLGISISLSTSVSISLSIFSFGLSEQQGYALS